MGNNITREAAQNEGASGTTGKKNDIHLTRPHFMQVLIGSRYVTDNDEHNYGHTALRIFIKDKLELIYDFGRYGNVVGEKSVTGDGILRVWTNSSLAYFATERMYGTKLMRKTSCYKYYLDESACRNIMNFFHNLEKKKIKNVPKKFDEYKLATDYHAILFNCTTLTIEGAKKSNKPFVYKPRKFRNYIGLTTQEQVLARMCIENPPDLIFMPEDLRAMIKGNPNLKYDEEKDNL